MLTLVILILLPGYVGWLTFGSGLRERVTAVETLFLILLTGITAVTWPAFFLAEIGQFSLPVLFGIVVLGSLLIGGWGLRHNGRSHLNPFQHTSFTLSDLLPFLLLIIPFLLSPEPFQYINGGRDHGVYVNTGIHIARTGSILFDDPELAALPPASRDVLTNPLVAPFHSLVPGSWSEGQRLVGLTIRDAEAGTVTPHAFHLYPVWIAIFQAAGGVEMALWTTAVFNWFGLLAIFVTASRLLGKPTASLALLLLIFNVSQVWFTHYPTAEIMVRFFFWGGLYALVLMLSYGDKYTAVLAGLSFGYLHLAKLDTFFLPLILLAIFGTIWLRQQWQKPHTAFALTYLLLIIHTAIHALFIATIYFFDQLIRVILPAFLAQPMAATIGEATYPFEILQRLIGRFGLPLLAILLITSLLIWLTHRNRSQLTSRLSGLRHLVQPSQILLATAVGLLILYANLLYRFWRISPLNPTITAFVMLSWYLSPVAVLLGTVGLMQFVVGSKRPSHHAAWILLLSNILFLLLIGSATYPDQFWAIRRFVPIVLPSFILFTAYAIWQLMPSLRQDWVKGLLPVGLAFILLILFWQNTRPTLGVVDYDGFITQTQQLDGTFPTEAVLLFTTSDATNRVALPLWTLFDRTLFTIEPEALTDEALATAVHQWQSQNRPVYFLESRQEPPTFADDLIATYVRTEHLSMPLMEGNLEGIPYRNGRFLAIFDVYEFTSEPITAPQTVDTLAVAWGTDEALLSGLYTPQKLYGLTPYRWTSGQVDLHFPLIDRPSQLLLHMANGRPPTVPPAEVTVYVGDTHLDTITVTGSGNIYTIPIPNNVQFTGETADFRLQIPPWVPAQTGHSADQRELGVYLNWAKIIVQQ